MDVSTLLERCRKGDDLAWESLVRQYQRRVFAVAYHYMRNADEARDMAQEIFIRIYKQLDSFRGERFLPWMLSVARNACIDRLRKIKARPPASDVPVDEATQVAAIGPSPEDNSDTESKKRLLYAALDLLSDTNREMVLLKEIEGLKLEEIAQLLKLPLGTVKSRSNRARVELAARVRTLDPAFGAAS